MSAPHPPTEPIKRFVGKWGPLSNFHPAQFTWASLMVPTSEHAYQLSKTLDPAMRGWVNEASSPSEAKRRGQRVELRPGWDNIKLTVMRDILEAKFTSKTVRERFLLGTSPAELVEGNTWHDNFWGDCTCGREACTEPGTNHLGRLLMELRTTLEERSGPHFRLPT